MGFAHATKETVELSSEASSKLFKWNIGAGCFMFITSIIIFVLSATNKQTVDLYTVYPDPDGRGNATRVWAPIPERLYEVNVGYFSAVFLLLSALDHLAVATLFRSTYEYYLKRAMNPFRWFEYSISASLMHIMIGILSGVIDIHVMLAIGFLCGTTMIFGFLQELMNSERQGEPATKTLLPFWFGCVPHLANWGLIMSYFFYGVSEGDPPGFVWAIIFILFIVDATFAINQYWQQKEKGKFSSYLYGEMAFIILSLTAKQLLAWINYGGTNSL
eukprot:m.47610 g.47610  ORF g.47610 m.47610 type:complete len:274 (-) comp13237_c1_seq1:477-1298(-)